MTTSSGQQTTQQQQQTSPWAPAIPALQSILGNIQGIQNNNTGINPQANAAIQQLQSNTAGINNLGPTVQNAAANYLGGDPYHIVNNAYSQYGQNISPITNPNNLNPYTNPALQQALNTANTDITNQIQGQFAAAGRTGSGYDAQTLARGLSQGDAAILANQYNTNVGNLLNANNQLYNAGIGTNTALGQNTAAGVGLASAVPGLATQGPAAALQASQAPFGLLTGQQGALASIGVPIAGLGGQSFGTGQTNTQYTPSPFSSIGAGIGILGGIF